MSEHMGLPYCYRLSPPIGQYALAALEFRALTGANGPRVPTPNPRGERDDLPRLVRARIGVDVGRSSYVAECLRVLAEEPTLEELLTSAGKLSLKRERFRIKLRESGEVKSPLSQEIERAFADTIVGSPDLSNPATLLVVIAQPDRWLLAEQVSSTARGWRGHEQRPFQYSSALPPRIARAMVNLVAAPGDRIIDPCCGVGTVLVEASSMGIEPYGWEINPKLAEHATANLCHHQQGAWIVVGDGRNARGRWGGAVLDLPYGQQCERVDSVCAGLVKRATEVADLIAVVSLQDLGELLASLDCRLLGVAELVKGHLRRRVHWASTPSGSQALSGG